MGIRLVLILLAILFVQCVQSPEDTSNTEEEIALPPHDPDTIIEQNHTVKRDTIIPRQPFPWAPEFECNLIKYKVRGVFPIMYDSLVALALEERLTNGFNPSRARSNYHGADYIENGIKYSAAIDISVRCLNENQIRQLLDELAIRGFAGWYRKDGEDDWRGPNHIHAIWVAAPLKAQLFRQVKNWLARENGLRSNKPYKFWTPKAEAIAKIRTAFNRSNPD